MDGVTLLNHARDAGIEVRAAGEQLHVRGPKRHVALVRALFEHKAELLDLLRGDSANDRPTRVPAYIKRCERCGRAQWGTSGRKTWDGAEVWWCVTCNATTERK